jgi:AcrR family transcriptional regulator
MTATVNLEVRKHPRQLRSRITVTALLDATARVLIQRGFADCTTNYVAEVAGVGIGSLYEYFPNKEALVAALVEREIDAFIAALERELQESDKESFREVLRDWLDHALAGLERRRDLLRVLFREYPYMESVPGLSRLPARMTELSRLALTRWARKVRVPEDPAGYFVIANMLGGVYLTQTLRPSAEVSREAMLEALLDVLLRVLEPRPVPIQGVRRQARAVRMAAEASPRVRSAG